MSENGKEIQELRNRIESMLERKMKTPADFEFLSGVVWERIHQNISSSTLKRVWGYAGKEAEARYSTKSILCRLLGYKDWDDFVGKFNSPEIESRQVLSSVVRTQNLEVGQKVEVNWLPDRHCVFLYKGGMQFSVIESVNSHLHVGDTFNCGVFMLDEPLLLDNVVHDGMQPIPYIAGSKSGLTSLCVVD